VRSRAVTPPPAQAAPSRATTGAPAVRRPTQELPRTREPHEVRSRAVTPPPAQAAPSRATKGSAGGSPARTQELPRTREPHEVRSRAVTPPPAKLRHQEQQRERPGTRAVVELTSITLVKPTGRANHCPFRHQTPNQSSPQEAHSPEFHGHTPSDVEAAEGVARGIGPLGAVHSPAQRETSGERRPPAGSHKCTNSRGRSTLRPYAPIDSGVLKLLSGGRSMLRPYAPIDSGVLKLLSGGRSMLRPAVQQCSGRKRETRLLRTIPIGAHAT